MNLSKHNKNVSPLRRRMVEELRNYQLYFVEHGTSPISLNAAINGLKFFCNVTLGRPELMAKMQPLRIPRTLPTCSRARRPPA